MNLATIEHHRPGAASGTPGRHIRGLACAALALMTASAGLGAFAEHEATILRARPAGEVVRESRFTDRGTRVQPAVPCTPGAEGTRVETMQYRFPTSRCPAPAVLDAWR